MKRTIPAGRIAISVWFAVALALAAAMSVCDSCGAKPATAAALACAPSR